MILYQISNARTRDASNARPLPPAPEADDVAEAVGWDHSMLYEQDGEWVDAASVSPERGVTYAGEPRFIGRRDSGQGYHVWLLRDRPGRDAAVACRPLREQDGQWVSAGPVRRCELPQAALDAIAPNVVTGGAS